MSNSGFGEKWAGPYQKLFTAFAGAVDLTAQGGTYPAVLPSGAIVKCTTSGNLVWTDDGGNVTTLPLVAGDILDLPFAIKSLGISTIAGWVLVYWHGGSADYGPRLGLAATGPDR